MAFIVMITASINYANLTIAGTLNRFKEIGIRKSSGAEKREIAGQFLIESILMSGIALLFAIIFYRILLAQFNAMWIFNQIGIRLHDEPVAYGLFFGFSILLGLLAG
ncbi:MAG: FtsX-like permease family protein [Lewinellaceae bacterium]|nr:FtsX-like permease family protein [Lewinellaceae bacterium]